MANFGLTQTAIESMINALQEQGTSTTFDTLFKTQLLSRRYNAIPSGKCIPPRWVEDCRIEAVVNFQRALVRGKFSFEEKDADLEKFFTTIYANSCVSFIRKNGRELGLAEPNKPFSIDEGYTEGLSEEATLIFKQAIEQLCEDCRERMRLFYWRGLSHDEIAARMDQNGKNPRNASASALRHCHTKLRNILKSIKFSW